MSSSITKIRNNNIKQLQNVLFKQYKLPITQIRSITSSNSSNHNQRNSNNNINQFNNNSSIFKSLNNISFTKTSLLDQQKYLQDKYNSRTYATTREKVIENGNSIPTDENLQERTYKELFEMSDYETIIKRFESLAYSSNEECIRYYFKALVYSGKINKANIGLPAPTKKMRKQAMEAMQSEEALRGFFLRFNHFPDVTEKIQQKPIVPIFNINTSGKTNLSWFDRIVQLLWLPVLLFILYSLVSDEPTKDTNVKRQFFAKEYNADTQSPTSFSDIKGIDEVKDELVEIVDYLLYPEKYAEMGAKLPKGVLLSGEPGTGKTMLARAIAGEAGVSFIFTTGSSFDEKYVGVGSRRIRDLFAVAREKQPCIIFIDEIDAVGKSRNNTQYNDTLLQLLAEMDGFEGNSQIMIIGATNAPNSLDPALLRPGRFDRHIAVPVPDVKGRVEILKHYLNKVKHNSDVKAEHIARATPGFTGADLSNLINTAAIKAVQKGKDNVTLRQIEEARDDILMGRARIGTVMSEEARRNTAYHEAGHALVAAMTDAADPIHKATIIQRGSALGMVSQLPEMDHVQFTRKQMMARLAICLAGRAAEEIFFGDDGVTSGASSDFQQASSLAYSMITKWGMSNKLGFTYHKDKSMSEEVQKEIDNEVKELLDRQYKYSKELIIKNKDNMENLVGQLLEKETLSGEEILSILNVKQKQQIQPIQPKSTNTNITPSNTNNNTPVISPPSPSGNSLIPLHLNSDIIINNN